MKQNSTPVESGNGVKAKPQRTARLLITLQGLKGCINIGKDIVRVLGAPAYICLRIAKDQSSIALKACEETDVMSFKVPEKLLFDRHCNLRIFSKRFVCDIMTANGMDTLRTYPITGVYSDKENVVIVPLKGVKTETV